MKRNGRSLLLALTVLMLSGCWDIKTIQDTNYVTALGFDYVDNQYVVYAQMLDFSNVAKQEGGRLNQPASVWSGHEKGETVVDAMTKLYQTSQQRMFWGQVSSFVFTQRAIEHGIPDFKDSLIRFREVRYTHWVYGTKEPIDRIFTTVPFFRQSPLGSILHQPEDNYRQRSSIRPMRLQRMVAIYREPGSSLLLPSLGIDQSVWKENGSNDPKLIVDGVFVVSKEKPAVWVADKELAGLRWIERDTKKMYAMLRRDGKPFASIVIKDPDTQMKPIVADAGDKVEFSIRVRANFDITELMEDAEKSEIEEEAKRLIASEITQTFEYGRRHDLDLYQFDHILYHDRFPVWSRLTRNGETPLRDFTVRSIIVDAKLLHSGMYKIKQSGKQY